MPSMSIGKTQWGDASLPWREVKCIIQTIQQYLQFPFIRYVLVVGTPVTLCSLLLGVTLVLKRFSFTGIYHPGCPPDSPGREQPGMGCSEGSNRLLMRTWDKSEGRHHGSIPQFQYSQLNVCIRNRQWCRSAGESRSISSQRQGGVDHRCSARYRVSDSLVHNLAKNGMPVVNIWEAFSNPGKYNIHEITADIQLPREEKQTWNYFTKRHKWFSGLRSSEMSISKSFKRRMWIIGFLKVRIPFTPEISALLSA